LAIDPALIIKNQLKGAGLNRPAFQIFITLTFIQYLHHIFQNPKLEIG
jgi:hypothetical protein